MTTAQKRRRGSSPDKLSNGNGGVTDYKAEQWRMAEALRGSMEDANYNHMV